MLVLRDTKRNRGWRHFGGVVALMLGVLFIAGAIRTVQSLGPDIQGTAYRTYQTSSSVVPGAPMAATSTATQLQFSKQSFRLRTGITTRQNVVDLTSTSAGSNAGCVVVSGAAYCSGANSKGELGNGTTTPSSTYGLVSTSTGLAGKTVKKIAVRSLTSASSACALADGQVYCWGDNTYNNLGNNTLGTQLSYSTTPVQVIFDGSLAGETVADIAAGEGHVCGVTTTGRAFCWGATGSGRIGDGQSSANRPKPVPVDVSGVLAGKVVTRIAAGTDISCAIASGGAYCWGASSLGRGVAGGSNVPTAVSTTGVLNGKTLVDIGIAGRAVCALDTAGKMYCWGISYSGVVADGTLDGNEYLNPIASNMSGVTGGAFSSFAVNGTHACGIGLSDKRLYCWGANTNGATARNITTNGSNTLQPLPATDTGYLAGKQIVSVSTNLGASCLIASDGSGYCAGDNSKGALGLGNTTSPIGVATPMVTSTFTAAQGVSFAANTLSARLEFAQKSAATCSAQTTGFQAVTATSAIAWATDPSVTSGAAISATANDPVSGATVKYQTYVSSAAGLTNPTAIAAGDTGLWDFSLKDNSGLSNQAYCVRMAQQNGTPYEAYTSYPEIITAQGVLSVGFYDAGGSSIASPSFALPLTTVSTSCRQVSAQLGSASQKLRIVNDTSVPGWTASIAATAGQTAKWQHASQPYSYDFNDPSGSPAGCSSGLDGDGIAGQMTINASAGSVAVTPRSGCSLTGITQGGSQGFVQGSANAITLLNASATAGTFCYWEVTGIGVTQTIPASVPAGSYTIDMTVTVLAQ